MSALSFFSRHPHTPLSATDLADSLGTYAVVTTVEVSEGEEKPPLPSTWSGTLVVEGEMTGDSRLISEGAISWETPLPLRIVIEDIGGHDGAINVGRILEIYREGNLIQGRGDFDLGSEAGREAARLVAGEISNGVSVDLDAVAFEIRERPHVVRNNGENVSLDEKGREIVAKGDPEDSLLVTTSAVVRAATIVPIPAFLTSKIYADAPQVEKVPREDDLALVAGAAPIDPPREWLTMPEASGPMPLTITEEGQVFGHLALWDTCHIAEPAGPGICVTPPRSSTDYRYFHLGVTKTDDGSMIPTGTIRFGARHADKNASLSQAQAHYENTSLAGADIHVSDGLHGIWVCGALRPRVTKEQKRELRAAPLSGDWRLNNGNLELIGALAVNIPGFPIPRPSGLVASGQVTSLVAAGIVPVSDRFSLLSDAQEQALPRMISKYLEEENLETEHERARLHERVALARDERKVQKYLSKRNQSKSSSKGQGEK